MALLNPKSKLKIVDKEGNITDMEVGFIGVDYASPKGDKACYVLKGEGVCTFSFVKKRPWYKKLDFWNFGRVHSLRSRIEYLESVIKKPEVKKICKWKEAHTPSFCMPFFKATCPESKGKKPDDKRGKICPHCSGEIEVANDYKGKS